MMTIVRGFLAACLLFIAVARAEPTLVAPDIAGVGDDVRVRVEGLDPDVRYWVTLVPETAAEGSWKDYRYVQGAPSAEVALSADAAGPHELRLHDDAKGYALYARRPIRIDAATPAAAGSTEAAPSGKADDATAHASAGEEWQVLLDGPRERTVLRLILSRRGETITGTMRVESGRALGEPGRSLPVAGGFAPGPRIARLDMDLGARGGPHRLMLGLGAAGGPAVAYQLIGGRALGAGAGGGVVIAAGSEEGYAHVDAVAAALAAGRPAPAAGACPPALQAWLDEALRRRIANRDPMFRPIDLPQLETHLGAPYASAPVEALLATAAALQGPCYPADRRKAELTRQFVYLFSDAKTYRQMAERGLPQAAAADWAAGFRAFVERRHAPGDPTPAELRDLFQRLSVAKYGYDIRQSETALRARQAAIDAVAHEDSFAAMFDDAADRFDLLVTLAAGARLASPERDRIVGEKLAAYLPSAAETFALEATNEDDAQVMADWLASPDPTCPPGDSAGCERIRRAFSARLEDMTAAFSRDLAASFARLPGGVEGIARRVSLARDAEARFGALLRHGEMAQAWSALTEERRALQTEASDALLTGLRASSAAGTIDAFEAAYFMPGDLSRAADRPWAQEALAVIEASTPYRNLPGADYLAALAAANDAELRALDARYTANLRRALRTVQPGLAVVAPARAEDFAADIENASVVDDLLRAYLLAYGEVYASCLGNDAVTFESVTTTWEVEMTASGVELGRRFAGLDEESFTVPARLAEEFRRRWIADPMARNPQAADILLNDSGAAPLFRGVLAAMARYRCDDEAMLALEQGMIRYSDVLRRKAG